jgi:hypothetical protein
MKIMNDWSGSDMIARQEPGHEGLRANSCNILFPSFDNIFSSNLHQKCDLGSSCFGSSNSEDGCPRQPRAPASLLGTISLLHNEDPRIMVAG